ncbi:MAG TPA: HAD-IA family hydrolase [Candidatus Acidoferrum sp.]
MPSASSLPICAFIFDLDGTLIDSKLDIVNSVNAMLRKTGRSELPVETISGFVGHGAPQLIASVLGAEASENDKKSALSIFLEHYEHHSLEQTRAYPGVKEGLAALAGYPKVVLTNKPTKASMQILKGLGLMEFFVAVYGGDSFERKKPDPAGALHILKELSVPAEQAAMVGDSEVDIQTARNASMQAIAVTYGFGNYNRVTDPADSYVGSLVDLCALSLSNRA